MKNNLFTDEKVYQIFLDYMDLSQKIKIEYLDGFISNIDKKIEEDFEIIKFYNQFKEREIYKSKLQILLFSYVGLRKKTFYKNLELSNKVESLENDINEYNENFSLDLDEIKNSLVNIFKMYYEILLDQNKKSDLKEIYTIYRTIIMCILHMLPQSYREELFEKEHFKSLKQELKCLSSYDKFTTTPKIVSNIKEISASLRKYIQEKYNVDLYEYSLELGRKIV